MRVFSLFTGADTGGWGWAMHRAFTAHAPDWTYRAMAATRNYIAYPEDLPYRQQLIPQLWAEADVIHLHNSLAGHKLYDAGQGKPIVLQHHGARFRAAPIPMSMGAARMGAVQIASTVDLAMLAPDVTWVPVPYDLAAMRAIREAQYVPSQRIRIAHAPTVRSAKGTDAMLAALERLAARYPIDVDLIEGQPWWKCLKRKARADIFLDQLTLGYGCNSVEAMAMGIPVVSGAEDPAILDEMRRRWGKHLPFADATAATIERVIERIIKSKLYRQQLVGVGTAHVERYHDERKVVPLMADIYASAKPSLTARAA